MNLITKTWFWITLVALGIVASLVFWFFGIPFFGTIAQITWAILISPLVITIVWLVVLATVGSLQEKSQPTKSKDDASQPDDDSEPKKVEEHKSASKFAWITPPIWILKWVVNIIVILAIIVLGWWIWGGLRDTLFRQPVFINYNEQVDNFPTAGSGEATKDKPVMAYLDPKTTEWRISQLGSVKLVSVEHPSTVIEDQGVVDNHETLVKIMPAGKYFVYATGVDKVNFVWYRKKK